MAKKEIDPTFGRRLREWRELRGLTQTQLGEKVGMQSTAIARLEAARREPWWGTVQKLAEALDITPNDFLAAPTEPPPKPRKKK
ncbi:MAG TPA: helix-turn-helix transcriptional regulator [Gemmataceae bacterium]|nr:helix-turn-helix transcriptional regulator [Gemmataceae bacterium]